MSSTGRAREALSTLADYTVGTVIVMLQLAMAERRGAKITHPVRPRIERDEPIARN